MCHLHWGLSDCIALWHSSPHDAEVDTSRGPPSALISSVFRWTGDASLFSCVNHGSIRTSGVSWNGLCKRRASIDAGHEHYYPRVRSFVSAPHRTGCLRTSDMRAQFLKIVVKFTWHNINRLKCNSVAGGPFTRRCVSIITLDFHSIFISSNGNPLPIRQPPICSLSRRICPFWTFPLKGTVRLF